jgi:hypothetical protein
MAIRPADGGDSGPTSRTNGCPTIRWKPERARATPIALTGTFLLWFGAMRMIAVMPADVREWITRTCRTKKPGPIVAPEQFDKLYLALPSDTMKLLAETDIESGLRWGELTEFRPHDIGICTAPARSILYRRNPDRL